MLLSLQCGFLKWNRLFLVPLYVSVKAWKYPARPIVALLRVSSAKPTKRTGCVSFSNVFQPIDCKLNRFLLNCLIQVNWMWIVNFVYIHLLVVHCYLRYRSIDNIQWMSKYEYDGNTCTYMCLPRKLQWPLSS